MARGRVLSATEFKAKCLALFDEIEQGGVAITIMRRGRPIAVVSPAPKDAWKSPRDSWAGKAKIVGDIVNTDSAELWEIVDKE
ncbi:MAG TPA: prevent-host-death family protein [Bryobacteraceae bacterium]|nr:prevent-host-death family protein [Bryobacteraceae bacterium]